MSDQDNKKPSRPRTALIDRPGLFLTLLLGFCAVVVGGMSYVDYVRGAGIWKQSAETASKK